MWGVRSEMWGARCEVWGVRSEMWGVKSEVGRYVLQTEWDVKCSSEPVSGQYAAKVQNRLKS